MLLNNDHIRRSIEALSFVDAVGVNLKQVFRDYFRIGDSWRNGLNLSTLLEVCLSIILV
jgi:hypothetical protein